MKIESWRNESVKSSSRIQVFVKCCFTSTETITNIGDREFKSSSLRPQRPQGLLEMKNSNPLLLYVHRDHKDYWRWGIQILFFFTSTETIRNIGDGELKSSSSENPPQLSHSSWVGSSNRLGVMNEQQLENLNNLDVVSDPYPYIKSFNLTLWP